MDFDRNRYFAIGILLFLIGVQFRMIDSFVLNETSTRALARMAANSQLASQQDLSSTLYANVSQEAKKKVTPPKWLGFALLTIGGVIALHALVLPKSSN